MAWESLAPECCCHIWWLSVFPLHLVPPIMTSITVCSWHLLDLIKWLFFSFSLNLAVNTILLWITMPFLIKCSNLFLIADKQAGLVFHLQNKTPVLSICQFWNRKKNAVSTFSVYLHGFIQASSFYKIRITRTTLKSHLDHYHWTKVYLAGNLMRSLVHWLGESIF